MTETMKSLRSTKIKMTKDGNGVKVSHVKINEVVLLHYNVVNNDY